MIKRSIQEENIKTVNIYVPNIRLPWRLKTVKNLPAMQGIQETWVQSLNWEDLLEAEMPTLPVLLTGKSHGQRSLVGYSPSSHKELDWAQSCLTLWDPMDRPYSSRLFCPWDSPGNNTKKCNFFLQGIFLIQGLNLHLQHWQVHSLSLNHQGSPWSTSAHKANANGHKRGNEQ